MTNWIDQRYKQYIAAQARQAAIHQFAIPVYEQLWEEVKLIMEAVKQQTPIELFSNGNPLNRIVGMVQKPSALLGAIGPRKVTISLSRDKHSITAPLTAQLKDSRLMSVETE